MPRLGGAEHLLPWLSPPTGTRRTAALCRGHVGSGESIQPWGGRDMQGMAQYGQVKEHAGRAGGAIQEEEKEPPAVPGAASCHIKATSGAKTPCGLGTLRHEAGSQWRWGKGCSPSLHVPQEGSNPPPPCSTYPTRQEAGEAGRQAGRRGFYQRGVELHTKLCPGTQDQLVLEMLVLWCLGLMICDHQHRLKQEEKVVVGSHQGPSLCRGDLLDLTRKQPSGPASCSHSGHPEVLEEQPSRAQRPLGRGFQRSPASKWGGSLFSTKAEEPKNPAQRNNKIGFPKVE